MLRPRVSLSMDAPVGSTGRRSGQYDPNYGNFATTVYTEIRREAFGEDIGQNSWLTAEEQDGFLHWLDLTAGKNLLDIACGAGGPALRIAARTGCSVAGIDLHARALETARALATERALAERAVFQVADAAQRLPFADAFFDAVTCIDAVNHLPDRALRLADWTRVLKPGGRLLFTDPIVVTGPLENAEVAQRSSTGFYLFVLPGYNERVVAECGLQLLTAQNATRNVALTATGRHAARATRQAALREIEGDEAFAEQQAFLAMTARLAREGRLSRILYVAHR